jgi:hypothetical protein
MTHPSQIHDSRSPLLWLARIIVGVVFLVNINAALAFILQPGSYVSGFEVEGVPGRVIVQGIGILFLMWNVTYPLVILHPNRHFNIYAIILIQQSIGVIGETWIWLSLPAGYEALKQTGLRFIYFDGGSLIAMLAVYLLLLRQRRSGTGDLDARG